MECPIDLPYIADRYVCAALCCAVLFDRYGDFLTGEQSTRWAVATTAVPASIPDLGKCMVVNLEDYHVVGMYTLTQEEVGKPVTLRQRVSVADPWDSVLHSPALPCSVLPLGGQGGTCRRQATEIFTFHLAIQENADV